MLYNKEVKQIKDQIVKQIIGNYLKGAGENTAYLKEVKASNLGAVFLAPIPYRNNVIIVYTVLSV